MFDFSLVLELLKSEPGHGLLQSFLLAGIWYSSKGIKTEIKNMRQAFQQMKIDFTDRIEKLENRMTAVEHNQTKE